MSEVVALPGSWFGKDKEDLGLASTVSLAFDGVDVLSGRVRIY